MVLPIMLVVMLATDIPVLAHSQHRLGAPLRAASAGWDMDELPTANSAELPRPKPAHDEDTHEVDAALEYLRHQQWH